MGTTERDGEEQVVVLELAGEAYGVEIERVQEIIRMQSITRVPNGPAGVEGVTNLRGRVIPVLDLRQRFGLAPTPPIVFHEMRGAILETLAAELMLLEWEDALVIETEFACDNRVVEVAFFMFPGPAMVHAVTQAMLVGVGRGRHGN